MKIYDRLVPFLLIGMMILFGVIMVGGCDPEEKKKSRTEAEIETLSKDLHYYKDVNTHLCFAGMYIGYSFGTITSVPCTPEVEKIAHSFASNK